MLPEDAFCLACAGGDDAPRLMFADWLTENGHPDLANWLRAYTRPTQPDPMYSSYAPSKCAAEVTRRRRGLKAWVYGVLTDRDIESSPVPFRIRMVPGKGPWFRFYGQTGTIHPLREGYKLQCAVYRVEWDAGSEYLGNVWAHEVVRE